MESIQCSLCHSPGADVCFSNCSCKVHARCVPVNLILSEEALQRKEQVPIAPGERFCPACQAAPVTSLRMLPLSLDHLEKAVELRRTVINETKQGKRFGGTSDDGVKLKFQEAPPEASYCLLLSYTGPTGNQSAANYYQRTGRWTDEERAYTDFLVECFDAGNLLMQPGTKLGEFLGETLLCKSSRLTKKMKHAKLSVRSYNFAHPVRCLDAAKFSKLEQDFLDSVPYEHLKLEISWHLTRMWRFHFADLCLQVNSKLVDFSDWFQSLETVEHRAMEAEDCFRKIRRQGLSSVALGARKNLVDSSIDMTRAVSSSTLVAQPPPAKRTKVVTSSKLTNDNNANSSGASITDTSSDGGQEETDYFMSGMFDLSNPSIANPPQEDDYTKMLDDLVNGPSVEATSKESKDTEQKPVPPSPFLHEIATYMESQKLPFVHADVWIPSLTKDETTGKIPLLHVGFVSRTDIPSIVFGKLNEFGKYSSKFCFSSGVGLPGLVFQQGKSCWEHILKEVDPRFFESSGEDKNYGIKSGLGLCIPTKNTCVVVCFYACNHVRQDPKTAAKYFADLAKMCPVPKWTPTIELDPLCSQVSVDNAGSEGTSVEKDDVSTTSASTHFSKRPEDEGVVDFRIAALLGDHMPTSLPASATASSGTDDDLVRCFIALRLLLLRPPSRRSSKENEMLDMIRRSYLGYSRDRLRSEEKVAHLIVKDWQFLCQAMSPIAWNTSPPVQATPTSQSHELPAVSSSQVIKQQTNPMIMPQPLAFINPGSVRQGS